MLDATGISAIGGTLRAKRQASPSLHERRERLLAEVLDLLAEELARPVLELAGDASDEELSVLLEEQAERWDSPEVAGLRAQLAQLQAASIELDPSVLFGLAMPQEAIAEMVEAFRLETLSKTAMRNRAAYTAGMPPSERPADAPSPPLDSGAYAPEVALLMLENRAGFVALIALRFVIESGAEAAPKRLIALARAVRLGSWATLRLLASLEGADVGFADVPQDARLNWREIGRARERMFERIGEAVHKGRASGLPIWPPIAR